MRRVNLLPKDERQRGLPNFQGATAGILLSGAAVVIIVVAAVSIFCILRLYSLNNDIADLDANLAEQNQRLQELEPYSQLEGEIAAKQPVADGVVRSRFAWDEFLQGLAFIIPEATSLETLTAEASPVDINAPLDQNLQPPGTVTFTGLSLPDYTNVADFIVRLNTLRFLANSELDVAELDQETYAEDAINFEISAEMITEVGARDSEVRLQADDSGSDSATDNPNAASAAEDQYAAGEQYANGERATASATSSPGGRTRGATR